ncbi:MAG: DnaJ domain-containing protein [Rhodospirillales bacterium]|nr:DnaJ domain-containing protein [Rhodospirillales bacterium]
MERERDPEGLYARLGIEPGAGAEAIAAAFRRAALRLHPDIPGTGDADAFVALKAAYDVLADPARRAEYDRRAAPERPAPMARTRDGGLAAAHPRPEASEPSRSFPPRLFLLWAGVLALSAVAATWLMLRLASGPTDGLGDGFAVPRATGPAPELPPLRPAGRANHYVLPGLGPAIVLRQDAPGATLRPAGTLAAYIPVDVLGTDPTHRVAVVRLAGGGIGFVARDRLARGDRAAAHHALCADRAGPPPVSGEILAASGAGTGRIGFANDDLEPAVVKLRDAAGHLVRALYLAPGARAVLRGLPGRAWSVEFAAGELWSRACFYFAAGERARRFRAPLVSGSMVTLPPDLPEAAMPVDIEDRAFARP